MDFKQINFLASYPKSGNTWLRTFLEAYFLGEIELNQMICSVPDDVDARHLPGDGSDPKKYPVDIQMLTRPMAMLRLVNQYNESKIEGLPLFVKTHAINMIANGIELLPMSLTKSIVYIVRDPRDIVISLAKHMGLTINEAINSMDDKYQVLSDKDRGKMADFISGWNDHVKAYLNCDTHNTLLVKYEELKADPVRIFRKILEHAGVDVNEEKIKIAVELTEIGKLQNLEKEKGFTEASPKTDGGFFGGGGKSGEWKDKLTPMQVRGIEKSCGSMMKRLGYLEVNKKWA